MLTGEDLARAYASLDVFVMPSESETLGFVVMEAMASGVPVVAVAAGGLLDIMTNCAGHAASYIHLELRQSRRVDENFIDR